MHLNTGIVMWYNISPVNNTNYSFDKHITSKYNNRLTYKRESPCKKEGVCDCAKRLMRSRFNEYQKPGLRRAEICDW